MDKPSPMTLLDELTTPVQFRILKLLLPFFPFLSNVCLLHGLNFRSFRELWNYFLPGILSQNHL